MLRLPSLYAARCHLHPVFKARPHIYTTRQNTQFCQLTFFHKLTISKIPYLEATKTLYVFGLI